MFLSFASEDVEIAREIHQGLQNEGVACWIFLESIPAGQIWSEVIVEAIEQSKALVVLVSPASQQSTHCLRELNLADAAYLPLVSVRVQNAPLNRKFNYYLATYQHFDAWNYERRQLIKDLALHLRATIDERQQPADQT